jgi:hypothetical protein
VGHGQASPNMDLSICFHIRANMEGKLGVSCWINAVALNLGTFYNKRYDTMPHVRTADESFMFCRRIELFALQITFQGGLSERARELIVLPIDHIEVGFHCGRTRKDGCNATAKLPQLRKSLP